MKNHHLMPHVLWLVFILLLAQGISLYMGEFGITIVLSPVLVMLIAPSLFLPWFHLFNSRLVAINCFASTVIFLLLICIALIELMPLLLIISIIFGGWDFHFG